MLSWVTGLALGVSSGALPFWSLWVALGLWLCGGSQAWYKALRPRCQGATPRVVQSPIPGLLRMLRSS
ncbi:hypothetical protein JTE90_004018 [Oedothorax gibbosus]|uniref:Uncharacterized protein n=1 Tax=Oedothorax gibbosus TaxID=931172 RepID=A0AAV6U4Z2_9ARAC|nr:hypothetical protein JTE90_004018 [Oedothorax gibbosus]